MSDWVFYLVIVGVVLGGALGTWVLSRFGSSGSSRGGGLGSL